TDVHEEHKDREEKAHQQDPGYQKKNLEIHVIAHSEGTVITFLGLLRALCEKKTPEWVKSVRGFMTIGSPINKHLILWPELWADVLTAPANPPRKEDRIRWCNYSDYGDPIGFRLKKTREWLTDHGWDGFFDFPDNQDIGFSRYPFPGKAHSD